MPGPLSSGLGLGYYFPGGWIPGQAPFTNALRYYRSQGFGGGAQGTGQLAESAATDQAVAPFYAPAPAGDLPPGLANQAFSNVLGGEASGRNAAAAATAGAQTQAGQGIENVGQAYGQDVGNTIQAQIALEQAKAAQSSGVFSDIMNGLQIAGGIGSEIVAPGNPFGFSAIANGASGFAGGGGGGVGGGSSAGLFGSLGNLFSGSSGGSLPSGFTAGGSGFADSGALPSYATNPLPGYAPWDITAYGPQAGAASGFSSLFDFAP